MLYNFGFSYCYMKYGASLGHFFLSKNLLYLKSVMLLDIFFNMDVSNIVDYPNILVQFSLIRIPDLQWQRLTDIIQVSFCFYDMPCICGIPNNTQIQQKYTYTKYPDIWITIIDDMLLKVYYSILPICRQAATLYQVFFTT